MLKNYEKTNLGVIKQINVKKIKKYDKDYVDNSYNNYGEKVSNISHLRLGYLLGVIKEKITSIIDVGYGNGNFLNVCKTYIDNCYGNDISGYKIPEGCEFVENILEKNYDVVCFFDSLEHMEDIDFISKLKTKYIYISLPNCHYFSDEWFETWKHRREDEHLWHFNENSLCEFMLSHNYEKIDISNIEDIVRIPYDKYNNILTGIFKKI